MNDWAINKHSLPFAHTLNLLFLVPSKVANPLVLWVRGLPWMLCSLKLKIKTVSFFFFSDLLWHGTGWHKALVFCKTSPTQKNERYHWKKMWSSVMTPGSLQWHRPRTMLETAALTSQWRRICFCLGTSWPSLSTSWCPCRMGCWFLLNCFRCSLTEWSWRLTCTLVRVFGHGCAVYGYLVCCKVPGKPQCFDNMCQKAEPVMALSCFINPSRLAICSLRSSCSYTWKENESRVSSVPW